MNKGFGTILAIIILTAGIAGGYLALNGVPEVQFGNAPRVLVEVQGGTGTSSPDGLIYGNSGSIEAIVCADNEIPKFSSGVPTCQADSTTGGVFGDLGDVSTSSDATGDIYYLNASGQITNLGIGSAGQVLEVSAGGIPEWDTDDTGAGGGAFAWTPSTTYNENTSATTTPLWLQDTLYASSTSFFGDTVTITGLTTEGLVTNSSAGALTSTSSIGSNFIASDIARDSELHDAVTVSGSPDYITLSGQDIVRGTVDISDDTNLAAGTGATLTGDSLSVDLGTAIDASEITDDQIGFADILYTITLAGNPALGASESFFGTNGIIFEGSTANTAETLLNVANPSSDITVTLPNITGTLASLAGTQTFTGVKTISANWVNTANPWAVNEGGTGAATFTSGSALIGNGTSAITASSTLGRQLLPSSTVYNERTLTVSGTANQITSSAGAQDLSANRTWTLSLPNHVIFPSSILTTSASSTNATTTNLHILGSGASGTECLQIDANGRVSATGSACGAGGSGDPFAWTPSTTYNENTSATTTPLWLQDSLYASSTVYIHNLTAGGLGIDSSGLVYGGATTTAGTGLTYSANAFNVDASQTQITAVGALNSGSITSGFGAIDNGASAITTTGLGTFGTLLSTGSTTFSGNATTTGIHNVGSLIFLDEIRPDGETCADGEILKKTGSNNWDCAADATAAGAADDFTFATNYNEISAATTSPLWIQNDIYGSSTIRVHDRFFGDAQTQDAENPIYAFTDAPTAGFTYLNSAMTFVADSTNLAQFNATEALFNTVGNNIDFRVRTGSAETHTLFVDAGLDNVGIGTSSPYAKLSVVGETVASFFTATTTTTSTFPALTSTNATTTNLHILGSGTSGTECLQIDANGRVSATGSGCGGGSSEWTDNGTDIHPNEATDRVSIGTTTPTSLASLTISATSTDTTLLVSFKNDTNSEVASLTDEGLLTLSSDLNLGSGAVIDFNSGDVTLTHSANTLTLGGGTLALGTNQLTGTESIQSGAYALASIDGDDINSNIAGNHLTLTSASPDTLDLDANIAIEDKTVILSATSSTNGIATTTELSYWQFFTSRAITLTDFRCNASVGLKAGTSTIRATHNTNSLATGGTDILFTTGATCGSDQALATTTFSDATIPADSFVNVWVSDAEPTGSRPGAIRTHFEYSIDD